MWKEENEVIGYLAVVLRQVMQRENGAAVKGERPLNPVSLVKVWKHLKLEPSDREIFAELLFAIILVLSEIVVLLALFSPRLRGLSEEPPQERDNRPKSFYDADGWTAYNNDVVPDIVHILRYNDSHLTFMDVVFLRSMYLNHRPRIIMVHCSPCGFSGPFVSWTEGINFTFVPLEFPEMVRQHSTVVARLHILKRYGGIYLSRDLFVVRPLRRFLHYEATLACSKGEFNGTSLMILHKNSRFLKLYIDLYDDSEESNECYCKDEPPVEHPVLPLVLERQHLVHCMRYGLQGGLGMLGTYDPLAYPTWRNAYAVHTHILQQPGSPNVSLKEKDIGETKIRKLDSALGQMARSVLFGTSDIVGTDVPVMSIFELADRKEGGGYIERMTS